MEVSTRKAQLLEKLNILQQKEEELARMIISVDASIQELGYRVDSSVDVTKSRVPIQSGIRMKGALSFRGKEKALEYFDTIDVDKDDALNYEDFRAVRGFSSDIGYVDAPEVQTSEAWRMYMTDRGLPPSTEGGVSRDQFMRYREILEPLQPLTRELDYLQLGYLPPRQKDWQRINALLREFINFRTSRQPPGTYANMVASAAATAAKTAKAGKQPTPGKKGLPLEVTPGMQDETFTVDELSYVFANLDIGIVLTKPEIALLLLDFYRRRRVLEQLLFKYAKRNLSVQDFPFSLDAGTGRLALQFDEGAIGVTSEDIKTSLRAELVPWLVGLPRLFDPTEIYRRVVEYKNKFIRGLRHVEAATRHMFNFAAHLNDRMVFRDFPQVARMPKALQEISNLKFGFNIGDESRREGGISGSFKMIKIDTPPAYFKQLKVPTDSGSILMIDWLFHSDTTEEQGNKCASCVRQFLGHHLEKELRGNKAFSGMSVTTALNEADDAKVLRIILSYKRIASLDGWLDHMMIPYGINDFVNVLVGDFRSNFDLAEVVANKVTSLSETFACSFDCTIGLRRNLVISLLERLLLVVSAGVTPDQVHEKDAEEATEGAKPDSKTAKQQSIAAEEALRRVERWRLVHTFFPAVCRWTSFFLNSLKCMKSAALRLKFNDIGDFIYKIGVMNVPFGRFTQRGWTHQAGYIREKFLEYSQKYSREMGELHLKLKKYLEKKKADDDARRIKELMTQQREQATAAATARSEEIATTREKLKRLGIDAHGSDLFHEDSADPVEHINQLTEEINKQDILNLITIENLRRHVIGVHSCEVVTGKAKISIAVHGLDIFELLPNLPNMQSAVDANSLRPKSRK